MTSPETFRNCCHIDIEGDHLSISCQLRDRLTGEIHELVKEYDLAPLVQFLHNQFVAMHQAEHGDTNVSGLASYLHRAKDAAARIASSKGLKELYKVANSSVGRAVIDNIPGGAAALTAANVTASFVAKARKGDHASIASLKKMAEKAAAGNPLAKELLGTAKTMKAMMDIKDGKNPSDLASRLASVEARLHPLYNQETRDHRTASPSTTVTRGEVLVGFSLRHPFGGGKKRVVRSHGSHANVKAFSKNRASHLPPAGMPSSQFHRAMTQAPADAMPPSPHDDGGGVSDGGMGGGPNLGYQIDSPEEMMANYTPDGDGGAGMDMSDSDERLEDGDMEVSGWRQWAYHTPYRSPVSALVDGDFGASTVLRSLYSDGLNTLISRAGK